MPQCCLHGNIGRPGIWADRIDEGRIRSFLLEPFDATQDPYEDTIKALDDLIDLLGQNPHHMPSELGSNYVVARRPGEYLSDVAKRSERVVNLMNHLIEDGLRPPNTYDWRRFREVLESACQFVVG